MKKFDCAICDKRVELEMMDPSRFGPNKFECPECGAVYDRVEARPEEELREN